MIETNLRILARGLDICFTVQSVQVVASANTPELREKICYRLRRDCGLIAMPDVEHKGRLVVLAADQISDRRMLIDDWEVTLSGLPNTRHLTLRSDEGRRLLPDLVERMVTHSVESSGRWWSFDSLRMWYEKDPFVTSDGIDAFRRFEVSAVYVEGVGIGVAADVGTAFFTRASVADFFDSRVGETVFRSRRAHFQELTQRQNEQHGTLLYYNGERRLKCYFEKIAEGQTCGNTSPRKVGGKRCRSLVEYYAGINPNRPVAPDTPVAFVSFIGLDHPQPVAATMLWPRVMNNNLPQSLINADKLSPNERRTMVEDFWQELGEVRICLGGPTVDLNSNGVLRIGGGVVSHLRGRGSGHALANPGKGTIHANGKRMQPKGDAMHRGGQATLDLPSVAYANVSPTEQIFDNQDVLDMTAGFWRPDADKVRHIAIPALIFGRGQFLAPPCRRTPAAYKEHFGKRLSTIADVGCYNFPALMERSLIAACPSEPSLIEAADAMMVGLCYRLKLLSGKPFDYRLVPYDDLHAAVQELGQEETPGTVLFILNDESAAYAEVALGCPNWKVKRVTQQALGKVYRQFKHGACRGSGQPDFEKGEQSWRSFLRMISLDVLQVMDAIPFRLGQAGEFEAQLVIDVSFDRRFYALSLLVARAETKCPSFLIDTLCLPKPDVKHEAINGKHLSDDIIRFVSRLFVPGRQDPLASLLIVRDGRLVGDELQSIDGAIAELSGTNRLEPGALVAVAELHKQTEKHLRMWDIDAQGNVTNTLEGTVVRLSSCAELLSTTGGGTLRQGTAEPMLIVDPTGRYDIAGITDALGVSAHLNWSSPGVAQRLPLPFKRTDEVLKMCSEQQIRRIS